MLHVPVIFVLNGHDREVFRVSENTIKYFVETIARNNVAPTLHKYIDQNFVVQQISITEAA